jgi:glycosyltransferase involved in cell wall biosynthesis
MSPIFRLMSQHPQLDLRVAYCTLRGVEAMLDPGFNATVKWDIPLLDGYDWVEVLNKGNGSDTFFGLRNSGLWGLIRESRFDAVLCYLGYVSASFWIAYLACMFSKTAFLFGTDASSLAPRDGNRWKERLKKAFWPILFSLADQVFVPSNVTRDLMLSLRVPPERVTLTPYAVNNEWWYAESSKVDRQAVRASWGAGPATKVILFCAKLQAWKRPADLLGAFAKLEKSERRDSMLVFAGEGHLRTELETEADVLGISDQVRFLGFMNQSQLPSVYTSSDLMVLPSEYEPFAVVVNEAYCCSCPVAVSDRVGAGRDLVAPVNPDMIFPCGDVDALARILRNCILDREKFSQMGSRSRKRIESWSPEQNIAGAIQALETAVGRIQKSPLAGGPAGDSNRSPRNRW